MADALELVLAEPWAIHSDSFEQILAIAQRLNDSPEAVAAKLGRSLENTRTVELRDGVAVVPVIGPVFRRANLFTKISGATSLEILSLDFNKALSDDRVESIVLDISSPGGQAAGVSEFAAMIRAADKRVVAYVGDQAASAAYWFASAAHEIVISDITLLGSIGVVSGYRAEKDGLIKIISSQSPLKQVTPETEEGKSEIQRVVDDLAAVFISKVAEYRGTDDLTVMSKFGRGGVLVGEKAVLAGMADRIGSLEDTIAGLSGATMEHIPMTTQKAQAPEITRAYLAEHHPDIVAAIQKEGEDKALKDLESMVSDAKAEGRKEGAEGERKRIQSVEAQSMPGHEKLIAGLKFDGVTTGEQAAVAVLAAEKKSRMDYATGMEEETPKPLKVVAEGDSQPDQSLPVEDRCKAEWEKNPDLRSEFRDLETFVAYTKAEESGRIRRIGGKS